MCQQRFGGQTERGQIALHVGAQVGFPPFTEVALHGVRKTSTQPQPLPRHARLGGADFRDSQRVEFKNADAACEGLYKALQAKGLEALYDDRDERAGAKFATMDLIGLPWRITVGPRGLANGIVELTSRRTGESEEVSPEAAVDRIAQVYAGR